jgi:hypothetical protein
LHLAARAFLIAFDRVDDRGYIKIFRRGQWATQADARSQQF